MTDLIDTGTRRKKVINGEYVSPRAVFCTVPTPGRLCDEITLALGGEE